LRRPLLWITLSRHKLAQMASNGVGSGAQPSVTDLLNAARDGQAGALDALFPVVYDELRSIARRQRRPWRDLTLDTTGLVHEAYLKLAGQQRMDATSRAHFFAVAATAMRHILCNHARDRHRLKRGGDAQHTSLDEMEESGAPALDGLMMSDEDADRIVALDDALQRLESVDPRQARIVEYRFFAGLSIEDTAAALGVSPATVKRGWTMARASLYRDMRIALSLE
jgi:RNA polymerase sigma factor (TIGR02999 family)